VRREALHPHGVVTYIVDRNINYTNVCVADCGFCAFYRRPKDGEGYTLSFEQIGEKIEETKALGGSRSSSRAGTIRTSRSSGISTCCATSSVPPDPHSRLLAERSGLLRDALPHGRHAT
jgi:hypothetical protein